MRAYNLALSAAQVAALVVRPVGSEGSEEPASEQSGSEELGLVLAVADLGAESPVTSLSEV